jgi:hypothetical protein
MSVASTLAPSRANASAVERPMPWPAAVTSARFPSRRPMAYLFARAAHTGPVGCSNSSSEARFIVMP